MTTNNQMIGQAGVLNVGQSSSNEWHYIAFDQDIRNPVVILMINSKNGSDPVAMRADQVTDTGFYFQIDEWNYLDGYHTVESISWMAVAEGIHTLEDGTTIVAENFQVDDSFTEISFDTGFDGSHSFSEAPIVLAQTVTTNDEAAVTTRLRKIDNDSFEIKLQGEEAHRSHADETVGVIAIDPSSTATAGTTGDVVKHNEHTITFDNAVSGDVVFFAQMQTTDGGDTATVRATNVDGTSATVYVEEEASANSEVKHTSEDVGFLALTAGALLASTSLALEGDSEGDEYYDNLYDAGAPEIAEQDSDSGEASEVLLLATFDGNDRSQIDYETGFHTEHDTLVGNKKNAVNEFVEVTDLGGRAATFSFEIRAEGGGHEGQGHQYEDWFAVEVNTGSGWQTLETFHATGSQGGKQVFTGDAGGSFLQDSYTTLSYDLEAGHGSAQYRFKAHSTAASEVWRVDNVVVQAHGSAGGTSDSGSSGTGDTDLGASIGLTDGTYVLNNHPDGAAPGPRYGLRLDGLNTGDDSDIFTFDFEADGAQLKMTIDGNSVHIFGIVFGGQLNGSEYADDNSGFWAIDFTYTGITPVDGDDDIQVAAGDAAVSGGTITPLFGPDRDVAIDLSDKAGANPFSFRLGDEDNDQGHRGFDGISGWGWIETNGEYLTHSDWLFTVGDPTDDTPPPPPADNPPIAESNSYEICEDEFIGDGGVIQANIITDESAAGLVDRDPDGDGFTLTKVTVDGTDYAPGEAFDLTLTDGNGLSIDGTATVDAQGNLTFTPADGTAAAMFQGDSVSTTFSYMITSNVIPMTEVTETVTFDDLSGGSYVSDQYDGVTISAERSGGSGNVARVYDTRVSGADNDLQAAANGQALSNVLIIQENNGSNTDPDDNASGGTITFTFDGPSTVSAIDMIDTEEPTPTVTLTKSNGDVVVLQGPVTANRDAAEFDIAAAAAELGEDSTDVVSMTVTLVGSGAVDNLEFARQIPGEPATATADVTITVEGKGEDTPPQIVAENDSYAICEGESVVTANIVDGDGLATTIDLEGGGTVSASGGIADGADPSNLTVTEVTAGGDTDGDGFSAELAGPAVLGQPVAVTVSNSDNSKVFNGTLTVDADGNFEFDTGAGFDALGQDEVVTFEFDYVVETPGGTPSTVTVDFDNFLDASNPNFASDGGGALVSDLGNGISVSANGFGAMVFNSDPAQTTGGDSDLEVNQGGVLIVSEDGDQSDPDDKGNGGTFTFTFDTPRTIESLDFIDTEEPTPTVTLTKSDGSTVVIDGPVTSDGTVSPGFDLAQAIIDQGLTGDNTDVTSMTVVLAGSGALDNLVVTEPGSGQSANATVSVTVVGKADPVVTGSISGLAFNDADRDGLFNNDDTVRSGVEVQLLNSDGTPATDASGAAITTATLGDGTYTFTDVAEGDYTVRFLNPDETGLAFTTANAVSPAADDVGDSDAVPTPGDANIGDATNVTVVAAQNTGNVDAGFVVEPEPGAIRGVAFDDPGADGVKDSGDLGKQGISVTVTDVNDASNTVTVATAADGSYEVTGLAPGTYEVTFVDPASEPTNPDFTNPATIPGDTPDDTNTGSDVDTSGKVTVTVPAGGVAEADAGYTSSSVGDRVWLDANGDGIQGAGETGVEGAVVQLLSADGTTVIDTVTTGADGLYGFDGLAAGDYRIRVENVDALGLGVTTQGSGTADDSDIDQATATTDAFTLALGEARTDIDAGLVDITISGQTFDDFFGTLGIYNEADGDSLRLGVVVELLDGSGAMIADTTTVDGTYSFSGLDVGDYEVKFTAPDDAEFTLANQTSSDVDDADDSDAVAAPNGLTGSTGVFTANQDVANVDAGFTSGVIGDRVWEDTNGDGVQDQGEAGLADVTVRLLNADGTAAVDGSGTAIETLTDASGIYRFENLASGQYRVEFDASSNAALAGYTFSPQLNAGAPEASETDSDADASGLTGVIDLGLGEVNTSIDAGLVEPDPMTGSIGDFIWFDTDGDGIQDLGETGESGVLVELRAAGSETVIASQTTGADGAYLFDNLAAGDYEIDVSIFDATKVFTLDNQGGDDGLDSDPPAATFEDIIDTGTGNIAGQKATMGTISLDRGEADLTWDAGVVEDTGREAGTINVSSQLFSERTTKSVVAIIDVSQVAAGVGGQNQFPTVVNANQSAEAGTIVDSSLYALWDLARQLPAQQPIAIVTNTAADDLTAPGGLINDGFGNQIPINTTITEFEGETITAGMISEIGGTDGTGLATSPIFRGVTDGISGGPADTVSVGEAIDRAVEYLDANDEGIDEAQIVLLTASTGASEFRNGFTGDLVGVDETGGDRLIDGKITIDPDPNFYIPNQGVLSTGVFGLNALASTDTDSDGKDDAIIVEDFFNRAPVELSDHMRKVADLGATEAVWIENYTSLDGRGDIVWASGTIEDYDFTSAIEAARLVKGQFRVVTGNLFESESNGVPGNMILELRPGVTDAGGTEVFKIDLFNQFSAAFNAAYGVLPDGFYTSYRVEIVDPFTETVNYYGTNGTGEFLLLSNVNVAEYVRTELGQTPPVDFGDPAFFTDNTDLPDYFAGWATLDDYDAAVLASINSDGYFTLNPGGTANDDPLDPLTGEIYFVVDPSADLAAITSAANAAGATVIKLQDVNPYLYWDEAAGEIVDLSDYETLTSRTIENLAGLTAQDITDLGLTVTDMQVQGDGSFDITTADGTASANAFVDVVFTGLDNPRENVLFIDSQAFLETGEILSEIDSDTINVEADAPFGLDTIVEDPLLLDVADIVSVVVVGRDTDTGTDYELIDLTDQIVTTGTDGPQTLDTEDTGLTEISAADLYVAKIGIDDDDDDVADRTVELVLEDDGNGNFSFFGDGFDLELQQP